MSPTAPGARRSSLKVNGKDHLILGQSRDVKNAPESKNGYLKGFDPTTGSELWKCQGLNSYVYTSPLVADGVAVNMSGYGGSALAVKLGGIGRHHRRPPLAASQARDAARRLGGDRRRAHLHGG